MGLQWEPIPYLASVLTSSKASALPLWLQDIHEEENYAVAWPFNRKVLQAGWRVSREMDSLHRILKLLFINHHHKILIWDPQDCGTSWWREGEGETPRRLVSWWGQPSSSLSYWPAQEWSSGPQVCMFRPKEGFTFPRADPPLDRASRYVQQMEIGRKSPSVLRSVRSVIRPWTHLWFPLKKTMGWTVQIISGTSAFLLCCVWPI